MSMAVLLYFDIYTLKCKRNVELFSIPYLKYLFICHLATEVIVQPSQGKKVIFGIRHLVKHWPLAVVVV